jgi:deazaflavin-dependent oxidoreductase (nitroreductase family)
LYIILIVNIHDAVYLRMQSWMVINFMRNRPGPFLRFLLRLPILQYRLGLQSPIAGRILILTTRGRKTGQPRQTALGYVYEPDLDTYLVMTGWGGRSDWYQNAICDPRVDIRVGKHRILARAVRLPLDENIEEIRLVLKKDPNAGRMFSALEGIPFDGSEEWFESVARHNPSMRFEPVP